ALAKAGESTAALDELERATDDPAAHAEAVRTLVDLSRQVNDKARLERWVLEAARLDRDAAVEPGARGPLDRRGAKLPRAAPSFRGCIRLARARSPTTVAARSLRGSAAGPGDPTWHVTQIRLIGPPEAAAERRLLDAHDPPVGRDAHRRCQEQQRHRV